ncbi:MAG TPA: CotH kinase family protein [Saprospiraceae bacterium]|nr:CotH kinase family protein [Saprospiraceae bacterium]
MKKILVAILAFFPLLAFAQNKAARPLFDKKTLGEVRLTLPSKNWVDALDSMRIYGMGMLNGVAVVDGAKYEGVGVRFRGDKSYQLGLKRNPFTIRLNHTDANQNHQGYTNLKLSAALRDPSLVREVLFYEIAGKFIPAPQANYTRLYVNDEYIGLFVNVESVDKKFLEAHYGSSSNAFFKAGVDYKPETPADCKQNIYGSLEYEDNAECFKGNFEMLSSGGWAELQELTKVLATDPNNVGRILDVDRTLWMLALDNVMVNLSSYIGNHSTNYFLYKDNNGRFQPIHWDLNLAFGSYKNTGMGSDLELKGLQEMDPLLHADNPYKPLVSQLLKDPLNRKIYLAHVRQILDDHFLNNAYEKRAKELQGSVVVPLADDKNKYYGMDDFNRSLRETVGRKSKIPGIVEIMGRRAKLLRGNEGLSALPPAVSEVNVQGRGKFENQRLDAFRITARADRFPKRMYIYYRLKDSEFYSMMVMGEEPTKNLPTGVKEFSAVIEGKSPEAVLDYYLVAENAGTVTFFPANYTMQPNKVKLSDLNK